MTLVSARPAARGRGVGRAMTAAAALTEPTKPAMLLASERGSRSTGGSDSPRSRGSRLGGDAIAGRMLFYVGDGGNLPESIDKAGLAAHSSGHVPRRTPAANPQPGQGPGPSRRRSLVRGPRCHRGNRSPRSDRARAPGVLRRVHGGDIPVERLGFEPAIAEREGVLVAEKERIAKAALDEIPRTAPSRSTPARRRCAWSS